MKKRRKRYGENIVLHKLVNRYGTLHPAAPEERERERERRVSIKTCLGCGRILSLITCAGR
jgi:hypothetical protein